MTEVIKLDWLSHHREKKGKYSSIFTLDYNPSNKSIATGGLDGTICIWNVDQSMSLLGSITMTRHEGSVMMLRWSPDGHLLASVSDDRTVLIWQGDRMIHRLSVGHQADLIALAWSPDSSLLASASIDGLLCIYDCKNGFNVIKTIKGGASGMLKGISWDPLNMFLACQGDDLVVWRCKDWTIEQRVVESFKGGREDSTLFKRPSWSPDGRWLCCANGTNGLQNAAIILNRNIWNAELSCIGHSGGIEVTSFSPIQYSKAGFVIAVGGEDRSVSLWSSNQSHPLVVVHDLFEHNVVDFTWTKEGALLVCSYDGTVGMITLKEELIGRPLNEIELNELQKDLQKSLFQTSLSNLPSDLVHVKLMNKLEESTQKENTTPNTTPSPMTITKDGKKRIVPILVDGAATDATAIPTKANPMSLTTTALSTVSATIIPPVSTIEGSNPLSIAIENAGIGSDPKEMMARSKVIRKIKTKMVVPFDNDHLIQIVNHSAGASSLINNTSINKRISTISMIRKNDGMIKWEDQTAGPMLMIKTESNEAGWVCCVNLAGDLFLYSRNGRRLLPVLMLGCPPSAILLQNFDILIILENGQFYHWKDNQAIQKGNIGIISGTISDLRLCDDRSFHFKIEEKRSVSYSPILECLVDNGNESTEINTIEDGNSDKIAAENAINILKAALEGEKEKKHPLSFMENKLAFEEIFSIKEDYDRNAGIYLLRLVREDFIDKATEFCAYLIQANRKGLLRDLLPLLTQNNGSPSWTNLIYEINILLQ